MFKRSFAEILASVHQMQAGLTANAETVAARGVTTAFVQQGQTLAEQLQAVDVEQETLKAALKMKTAEAEHLQTQVVHWYSEASAAVKLAYREQPEKWLEFGVTAKR